MRRLDRRAIVIVVTVLSLLATVAVVTLVLQRERGGATTLVERWAKEVADDPEDVGARVQLGYAYQVSGQPKRALAQYEAALEKEPRNTAALFNKATIMRESGEPKLAEEGFWDVLEIEPDHVGAAAELGRYYASKEQYRSMLAAVRPVVSLHPESAELQYLTGLAYENLGELDWARARYGLALDASEDFKAAREGLKRLGGER